MRLKHTIGCKCCGEESLCRQTISSRVPIRTDVPLGIHSFWIQGLTSVLPKGTAGPATVELDNVNPYEQIKINGFIFTAKLETDKTKRQFDVTGEDHDDAVELASCINDPLYGVPSVTASVSNSIITLTPRVIPHINTITLTSVPNGHTFTIAGLVFTAGVTTDVTLRQFSISGLDTADATELARCVNDSFYGIKGAFATTDGNKVIFIRSPTPATPSVTALSRRLKITLEDIQIDDTLQIISDIFTAKDATDIDEKEFSQQGNDESDTDELISCLVPALTGMRIYQETNILGFMLTTTLTPPFSASTGNFVRSTDSSFKITIPEFVGYPVPANCNELSTSIQSTAMTKYRGWLLIRESDWIWTAENDGVSIYMELDPEETTIQTAARPDQKIKFHNIKEVAFTDGEDTVSLLYNGETLNINSEETTLKCCINFQPLTVVSPLVFKQKCLYVGPDVSDPNIYTLQATQSSLTGLEPHITNDPFCVTNNGTWTATRKILRPGIPRVTFSPIEEIGGYDLGSVTLEGTGYSILSNLITNLTEPVVNPSISMIAPGIIYSYQEGDYRAQPERWPDYVSSIRNEIVKSWPAYTLGRITLDLSFVRSLGLTQWKFDYDTETEFDLLTGAFVAAKYKCYHVDAHCDSASPVLSALNFEVNCPYIPPIIIRAHHIDINFTIGNATIV